jgi:acetoin utilization deacetylase AcuC-like enzyme
LVSAGFDAHYLDPMADLRLTAGDYAELALVVGHFVPTPGRLAFFLEGGYDLGALHSSVYATLSSAIGGTYQGEKPSSGGPGDAHVATALRERQVAFEAGLSVPEGEALL